MRESETARQHIPAKEDPPSISTPLLPINTTRQEEDEEEKKVQLGVQTSDGHTRVREGVDYRSAIGRPSHSSSSSSVVRSESLKSAFCESVESFRGIFGLSCALAPRLPSALQHRWHHSTSCMADILLRRVVKDYLDGKRRWVDLVLLVLGSLIEGVGKRVYVCKQGRTLSISPLGMTSFLPSTKNVLNQK